MTPADAAKRPRPPRHWAHPRDMPAVTGRFLLARFASMLVSLLLLVGSFLVFTTFARHIDNDFVRWFTGAASLVVGLWFGYVFNHAALAKIDPDGAQRTAVRTHQ